MSAVHVSLVWNPGPPFPQKKTEFGICGDTISHYIEELICTLQSLLSRSSGGTAAAVPPPFRPGNPALCGSRPLVTPYYSRLGDLLYVICIVSFSHVLFRICVCFLLFDFSRFSFVASSFSTLILLFGSFDL